MIVLDATVLIAHLAGDDMHADRALDIIDTEEELALHPLTLAECLVGPARLDREDEALQTIARLGIEQLPFSSEQPLALAKLRAGTSLKLPDCCVLSAALESGARLATFDDKLARVAREHGVEIAGSALDALEEAEDVAAFDAAMAEEGPNLPWSQVNPGQPGA